MVRSLLPVCCDWFAHCRSRDRLTTTTPFQLIRSTSALRRAALKVRTGGVREVPRPSFWHLAPARFFFFLARG
jgi:hypothetical protein